MSRIGLTVLCLAAGVTVVVAGEPADGSKKPSVLIVNGMTAEPLRYGDFNYFQRLHEHGFQIDNLFLNERPLDWNLIKQYNCLVILDLPPEKENPADQGVSWNKSPPYKKELLPLLDAYLKQGGGIFFMPALWDWGFQNNSKYEEYLKRWDAKLPFESVQDPASLTVHPRNRVPFVYTQKIAPSPVSDGVKGIWFPGGDWMTYWSLPAMPLLVSKDWIEVVRGSDTSFTKDPTFQKVDAVEERYYKLRTRRPDPKTPPTLYAIREMREGRLALCAMLPQFTVLAGTTWIHDGVVLDKGIAGRPSDFGKLFENTLRWLSEPSLKSGSLGGYVQDPKKLVRPNLRKKPDEFFSLFNSYQNPTPPGNVYRGLVGARTTYSSGRGTVEEYARAATDAGLDFIVFLEEFGKKGGLTEAKYRNLEADCKRLSTDKLLLIPGFSFRNNIGNHQFVYGFGILWPTNTQFVGPNGDQLRHQCFDKEGKLDFNDEDAKNWLWTSVDQQGRNIGYYNFVNSPADTMPVRDLRLFGILGVMTYLDGKLVEDLTPQYISYEKWGDPPAACAVEIIHSPAELVRAVKEKHYLTHVAAKKLADLPTAMQYSNHHCNVNPSSGPRIKSWAGWQRTFTYAGEPFVPSNYRIRPYCWVTSDVGLKEIVVYDYTKPYRRILLHGAKEFKRIFEWAFDRHHVLTLEVTDLAGNRAVSAGLECGSDANFFSSCADRQNGQLWHGPLTMGTTANNCSPGLNLPQISVGTTWDGGPPPPASTEFNIHPGIRIKPNRHEGIVYYGGGDWMAGDMWPTCIDDCVTNFAVRGDDIYAPGKVCNGGCTLGPMHPSEYMTFTIRRTGYLQRPGGVSIEWHPMWPERVGGNLALIEGTMTFKKDTPLEDMHVLSAVMQNYSKQSGSIPLLAIRRNGEVPLLCGPQQSLVTPDVGISPSLGLGPTGKYAIDTGGYFAVLPTGEGVPTVLFNTGTDPLLFSLVNGSGSGGADFTFPVQGKTFKAGDCLSWRFLVIMDNLDQPVHNLHRIERIWQYYGLDGKHTCGIKVKRGKLVSHFGLVDLAPEGGVLEFEVPAPDFLLDLPLGLRFIGFNPNWALGQLQVSGYSMGYYTNGANVYRNLGIDDRKMAYLAVYPDNVPLSHSIVGHPIQCDNPQLVIEFAQLNAKPMEYRLAVNNPTDAPIKTTLKKCMDLPGFEFADTAVDVPPGGYQVIREK
jgi:hypothetical protein